MRKAFEIGGLVAAVVLVAFGVAAIVMGFNGRDTVQSSLKQEAIVGTPDMNKTAIAAEAKKAGLPASLNLPTADIAGKPITNGKLAREFATYMRIHTLEATGGLTYAQMPRFATADGKGTNDPTKALTAKGQPVDNPARSLWVTETALTTALNSSYMAEQALRLRDCRRIRAAAHGRRIRSALDRRRTPEPGLRVRTQQGAVREHIQGSGGARGVGPTPPLDDRGRLGAASVVLQSLFGEKAMRDRVPDELGTGGQAELLHDVRPVRLGRSDRDVQLPCDLLVGVAERQEPQDLAFAVGERVLRRSALLVGLGGDQARAELGVHVPPAAGDLTDRRHHLGVCGFLQDVPASRPLRTRASRTGGRPASRARAPALAAARGGVSVGRRARSGRA